MKHFAKCSFAKPTTTQHIHAFGFCLELNLSIKLWRPWVTRTCCFYKASGKWREHRRNPLHHPQSNACPTTTLLWTRITRTMRGKACYWLLRSWYGVRSLLLKRNTDPHNQNTLVFTVVTLQLYKTCRKGNTCEIQQPMRFGFPCRTCLKPQRITAALPLTCSVATLGH